MRPAGSLPTGMQGHPAGQPSRRHPHGPAEHKGRRGVLVCASAVVNCAASPQQGLSAMSASCYMLTHPACYLLPPFCHIPRSLCSSVVNWDLPLTRLSPAVSSRITGYTSNMASVCCGSGCSVISPTGLNIFLYITNYCKEFNMTVWFNLYIFFTFIIICFSLLWQSLTPTPVGLYYLWYNLRLLLYVFCLYDYWY